MFFFFIYPAQRDYSNYVELGDLMCQYAGMFAEVKLVTKHKSEC